MLVYKIVEIEDGCVRPQSMGCDKVETVIGYYKNLPVNVEELTNILYQKVYKYHGFDSSKCLILSNILINERLVELNKGTRLALIEVRVNEFKNLGV